MSALVYTCGLYRPGHDVHYIQARLGAEAEADANSPPHKREAPGRLLEATPTGVVFVEVAGIERRLWNHNPERLKNLVGRNDGEIRYQPEFSLLLTKSDGGAYVFCVADADDPELRPCPVKQSPDGSDL